MFVCLRLCIMEEGKKDGRREREGEGGAEGKRERERPGEDVKRDVADACL